MDKLKRYRFKTRFVDDPRPIIDLGAIKMPWWCTGYGTIERLRAERNHP